METGPPSLPAADEIRSGDQRALARAITLVESTRADHREAAVALLEELIGDSGHAIRVGISGPPGVGKSTFIEALGMYLVEDGHRVAVLAVDPSSSVSGGSILGDKTRMEALARDPNAFIRPSPSSGELGGVALRTREAMLLCEAAGFGVVLVETVGVGQSEIAVADLTDLFVLLASPAGGDDLQGIKRGIMELADLVLVTKADGEFAAAATNACADIRRALHLMRPRHRELTPEAMLVSSIDGAGIEEAWQVVATSHEILRESGELAKLRSHQARKWMWSEINAGVMRRLRHDPASAAQLAEMEQAVGAGTLSPSTAAYRLLDQLG